MRETPRQYSKRIVSYVGNRKPLAILRVTPRWLARLKRVPRKLIKRRPAPGKWSIGEIVAHLADVELVIGYRIRMMLSANRTPIQAIDQDKWAKSGGYGKRDVRRTIEAFGALRENNLALLQSVPKKKWSNYGLHVERGRESIAHTVRLYAGHDLNHLEQIDGILKQFRRGSRAA